MNFKRTILSGSLIAVLLVLAFGVGQVLASTGCFSDTNGYWAETYICWLKDNGISAGYGDGTYHPDSNITRGEMAVFLQKINDHAVAAAKTYTDTQDATNLAAANSYTNNAISTGQTYIIGGLDEWRTNGGGTGYVQYYTNVTYLRAPGAGSYGFQFTASLPGSLYGHEMWFRGVQLCYDATGGASLSNLSLQHYIRSGTTLDYLYKSVSDSTVRTDAICRTYNIADPIGSLWGNNHVALWIQGTFTDASSILKIYSTTFIIEPSASSGSLNSADTEQAPVTEGAQPAGGQDSGQ